MLNSAIYDILISPKYRALRYTLLCIAYLIFSYSETFYHYSYAPTVPFIILVIIAFLGKIITSAIMIILLLPLLLKQRYTIFVFSALIMIFMVVWLQQITLEDMICKHFNLPYWRENTSFLYILIDLFSQNVLWIMAVLGVLMGRMLKCWNDENKQIQQIQASQLQMEAESMKERVSPSLLCSTLRKGGESALAAPKKTSDILMQLSRLLRYQLYDCHREKVLLESELKFLREYLSILKYNSGCSDFNLSVTGQTMGIIIPPLLFIPFLQSEETPDKDTFIDIRFNIQGNLLTFDLADHCISRNDRNIRYRLEQLYAQKYDLTIVPNHVTLKIQIG